MPYTPSHLSRWSLPRDYCGAHWDGYYTAPVGRSRDSSLVEVSNWENQLELLKPFKADVEADDCVSPCVVTENHWAVGWVEWLAIHESNEAALKEADRIAERLEDYPLLNEEDLSEKENDAYGEAWDFYGLHDFKRSLVAEFALCSAADDFLDSLPSETLRSYFESLIPSGEYYHAEGDGVSIQLGYATKRATRDNLATFLREQRALQLVA